MEWGAIDLWRSRDWERLPLFPDLAPCETNLHYNGETPFEDPFLAELVLSRPMQRLKRIGFLGAIDYARNGNGIESHRRRHNRYDHSVGVAQLSLVYAEIRGLPLAERRLLSAAGLLHDIGHGPLSHTLEPVFERAFGINHHSAGREILCGRSPLGRDIEEIMARYRVDLDEVVELIEGRHEGPHSYLFSSPISLDTIEGINRCRSSIAASRATVRATRIVEEIASCSSLPASKLDTFWTLKHDVYNSFILHCQGLMFDGLAQAYVTSRIDEFRPSDFLKTENQLRHKKPALFHILAWAKVSKRRLRYRLSPYLFDFEVRAPKRCFAVDRSVQLATPADLWRRYRQHKAYQAVTLGALIEPELEAA